MKSMVNRAAVREKPIRKEKKRENLDFLIFHWGHEQVLFFLFPAPQEIP